MTDKEKRRKYYVKPLGDRIVIKVIEDTEQTSGGILFLTVLKKNLKKAKLLQLAQEKITTKAKENLWTLKTGDTILYAKYAGTDIKMDGVEYKILSVKDALAIIE